MYRQGVHARALLAGIVLLASGATPVFAQTAPPVKRWATTLNFGVTVTSGNRDTSTYSAGVDIKYDTKAKNVLKIDSLFIRGKTDGEVSTSRLSFRIRDDYQAHGRIFLFAQAEYLQDRFKQIDYLVAPTTGMGVKFRDSATTKFSINAGIGGVWEKNAQRGLRTSGALTLGQTFSRQLSPSVSLTQTFNGLGKVEALDDALLTMRASLTASLNSRTQFKIEWIDTYKTRPPSATVRKNDMTALMGLVLRY